MTQINEVKEAKNSILDPLKEWANRAPQATVTGASGKVYTRDEWVKAIIDETDDAVQFLLKLHEEAKSEMNE